MEIVSLSKDQLKKLVQKEIKTYNRRFKANKYTANPLYTESKKAKLDLSIKGKNRNQLLSQYIDLVNTNNLTFATNKGFKTFAEDFFGQKNLSVEEINRYKEVFDKYEVLKQLDYGYIAALGSDNVINLLKEKVQENENFSNEQMLESLQELYDKENYKLINEEEEEGDEWW